jgi:thymidylate synthase (FAD)
MKVKLVSLSKSLIAEKDLTPEELIVYVARVSNPSNQLNTESSEKLINYLIKHAHWSPFEMVDMCVEIVTSRGIAPQILRHRSFSFQEFSQRYAKVNAIEPIELRYKGDTNRQSSSEAIDGEDSIYFNEKLEKLFTLSQEIYNEMIDADIAKECARFVLPLASETTLYMKSSIRSWIHYLQIRCDEHTQLEHRLIAEEIKKIFIQNFPSISKALNFI